MIFLPIENVGRKIINFELYYEMLFFTCLLDFVSILLHKFLQSLCFISHEFSECQTGQYSVPAQPKTLNCEDDFSIEVSTQGTPTEGIFETEENVMTYCKCETGISQIRLGNMTG